MSNSEKNPIEVLLSDSDENIILHDADGKPVEFEQVALIPIDEGPYRDRVFALLRPLDDEDLEADEAVVYELEADEERAMLTPVEDEDVLHQVFTLYYELLRDTTGIRMN